MFDIITSIFQVQYAYLAIISIPITGAVVRCKWRREEKQSKRNVIKDKEDSIRLNISQLEAAELNYDQYVLTCSKNRVKRFLDSDWFIIAGGCFFISLPIIVPIYSYLALLTCDYYWLNFIALSAFYTLVLIREVGFAKNEGAMLYIPAFTVAFIVAQLALLTGLVKWLI